jgi:beta-N-acetylhexosaminidase
MFSSALILKKKQTDPPKNITAAYNKKMKSVSLEQKIGQLFIIGFEGDTLTPDHPVAQDIAKRNLGGVILFDRLLATSKKTNNISSPTQLTTLIASLQELAQKTLFIAVDQEGGLVSRFKNYNGFPVSPAASELGRSPDLQLTRQSGRQTAQMLSSVGVNLNLAPVVDLNIYLENPIIGKYNRSFSASGADVTAHAAAWVQEHRLQGVLSCLKHFPGHGSSRADSHLGFVEITETWQEIELQPFQQLISEGLADAIMLGHLFNRNLDEKYPATLSRKTIQSLLRNRLAFDGVIISDDMQMRAITDHYGLGEACCKALAAGVDLLIVGNNLDHDPLVFPKLRDAIRRGLDAGTITEERIEKAWSRVQHLKQSLTRSSHEHRVNLGITISD